MKHLTLMPSSPHGKPLLQAKALLSLLIPVFQDIIIPWIGAMAAFLLIKPATLPIPTPLRVHIPFPLPVIFRSEEHTSELQSRFDLVCRLLLEKKNTKQNMK